MTYMTHDTVTKTAVIDAGGLIGRIANWLKAAFRAPAGEYIDPRNEHLLRDAGITPGHDSAAIDRRRGTAGTYNTSVGTDLRFLDLYLSEHLDRGPRNY